MDSAPLGSRVRALTPRRSAIAAIGPASALVGLWALSALALSEVTGRVTNWFVMTDELVYERLAISVARTGSPVPRVHGTFVRSLDQLYPWLIAPFFRHGDVATDIHHAHLLGAWLMTSALIPAFLLARRVTGRTSLSYLAALLSVATPWLIYSSFLLTETVAYPVFVWALLAIHRALTAPSARNDALALTTIVLAFLARTELVLLAAVLPIAILLQQASIAASQGRAGLRAAVRAATRAHRLLLAVYGALIVAGVAFVAGGGRLLGLSVYGQEINGNLAPSELARAFDAHAADIAFGLGILPFVVGTAWLLANVLRVTDPERHAFACVGVAAVVMVIVETARYDLGLDLALYDRYLFYIVPVVVLAFVSAMIDRPPRWSLIVPAGVVCLGFADELQAAYTWTSPPGAVDPDTPISIYYHPFVELAGSTGGARALLAGITLAVTCGYVLYTARPARSRLRNGALLAVVAVGLASSCGYVFYRLFDTTKIEADSLTGPQPASLDWVDQTVGANATVTEIPYEVSSDYFVSLDYWRNLEFWNKSVTRDAEYPSAGEYSATGIWFPRLLLSVNTGTGTVAQSPSPYVVQSVNESRFRIAGNIQVQTQQALLIDATRPWRLSWMTFGLSDDGWLQSRAPARIRVFSLAGQKEARTLEVSLQIQVPGGVSGRPFRVRTNLAHFAGIASDTQTTFVNSVPVCVPAHGHADVTLAAVGLSGIPSDLGGPPPSEASSRVGSIDLADTSVSDNVGPPCKIARR